jgi:hypothetical protein
MSLRPTPRAAYVALAERYNGKNNGMIVMSVGEMAKNLNVSKPTAWRAIRDLCDHGLVKVGFRGSFKTKSQKLATTYLLTLHRDDRTGNLPTRDFLARVPPSPSIAPDRPRPKRPKGQATTTTKI